MWLEFRSVIFLYWYYQNMNQQTRSFLLSYLSEPTVGSTPPAVLGKPIVFLFASAPFSARSAKSALNQPFSSPYKTSSSTSVALEKWRNVTPLKGGQRIRVHHVRSGQAVKKAAMKRHLWVEESEVKMKLKFRKGHSPIIPGQLITMVKSLDRLFQNAVSIPRHANCDRNVSISPPFQAP